MIKEGVLPLFVDVENNGQQLHSLKSAYIILREGDIVIKELTAEEAAGKAKKSAVGRALGWSMIVPIIGIPIAVAASATHTKKVNKQMVIDFKAKAFQNGELKPDQKRSDFLFFELPKNRKSLDGLHLEMTLKNIVTEENVTFATPLPAVTLIRAIKAKSYKDSEEKDN